MGEGMSRVDHEERFSKITIDMVLRHIERMRGEYLPAFHAPLNRLESIIKAEVSKEDEDEQKSV